jgi:membrane protein DedA with SNARE-associated domain
MSRKQRQLFEGLGFLIWTSILLLGFIHYWMKYDGWAHRTFIIISPLSLVLIGNVLLVIMVIRRCWKQTEDSSRTSRKQPPGEVSES